MLKGFAGQGTQASKSPAAILYGLLSLRRSIPHAIAFTRRPRRLCDLISLSLVRLRWCASAIIESLAKGLESSRLCPHFGVRP